MTGPRKSSARQPFPESGRLSPRPLYKAPRLNLEYPQLAWLKALRSAGSRVAAQALAAGVQMRYAYDRMIGAHKLHVTEYDLDLPGLTRRLDGLRLVHLTDIHHGPWLPLDLVRDVVKITNSLEPDLVALTGDYVVNSPRYIQPVADELAALRPGCGTVAVLGNHDWWEGGEEIREALSRRGICMLDNGRCYVTPEGKLVAGGELPGSEEESALFLAGVGDCWTDTVEVDKALDGLPIRKPCILLSHNPEVAEDPRLAEGRWRIDLMLSGHTHGGQVRPHVFGARAVKSRRRLRYAHGLVKGPACLVYISRGIGTAGIPLRVNMPPEIALFRFRSMNGG